MHPDTYDLADPEDAVCRDHRARCPYADHDKEGAFDGCIRGGEAVCPWEYNDKVVPEDTPSMEPQCFCSLPWCGKAFGGQPKRFHVNGKILEYPVGMDFHHVNGAHKGPGIFICHGCH